MNFPVSIKGVLVEAGRVVLLENERDEWELPGGRLEPGEAPMTCLVREFAEELGAVVVVASIIDCWVYGFCLNARSSSSPTVCSAATRKSCVSAMNIGVWALHASRNRSLADTGRLPAFNTRMVCTTR